MSASTAEAAAKPANHSRPISRCSSGESGHECRALPRRSAGDPATSWPALTLPITAEPGSTCAPAPTVAPGISVLRAPTLAPGPIRMAPMWTRSPSIHQPDRSTSGSILDPVPRVSSPVTGGSECSWTFSPIFAPERFRVVGHPGRAGEADGAGEVLDLFREPEPEVHPPGPGIGARHHVAQQDAGGGNGEQHPPGGTDEDQPGRSHPPP